jgi:hypothetical protein
MNSIRFIAISLALSVFTTGNAFAQMQIPPIKVNKLEEVTLLNAFEEYSNEASENFLNNDMKLASKETRKALALVKKDSLNTTIEGEELLNKSSEELEKVAQYLETGISIQKEDLKEAFMDARNAIIINHHYRTIKRLGIQASNPASIH